MAMADLPLRPPSKSRGFAWARQAARASRTSGKLSVPKVKQAMKLFERRGLVPTAFAFDPNGAFRIELRPSGEVAKVAAEQPEDTNPWDEAL